MLGVLPIQKPDAYIHFAPKERMELKYCVSISASPKQRVKHWNPVIMRQIHEAISISLEFRYDSALNILVLEGPVLRSGVRYIFGPYPRLLSGREVFIQTMLFGSGGGGGPLNYRPPADRTEWLKLLFAPFDSKPIEFKHRNSVGDPTGNTESSWTFLEAESIKGRSVYHLKAERTYNNEKAGQINSRVDYWFRIADSSVERCETTIPLNERGYSGFKFVVSRIR